MLLYDDLPMQVVGQVYSDEQPSRRRVYRHVVCRVIQELSSRVSLDVVRIVVAPTQLDIQPILLCCGVVHCVSVGKILLILDSRAMSFIKKSYF